MLVCICSGESWLSRRVKGWYSDDVELNQYMSFRQIAFFMLPCDCVALIVNYLHLVVGYDQLCKFKLLILLLGNFYSITSTAISTRHTDLSRE
jgi:hypothetical protein